RRSLLELAPQLGLEPEERRISIEEWREGAASGEIVEAFACGTAARSEERRVGKEGRTWSERWWWQRNDRGAEGGSCATVLACALATGLSVLLLDFFFSSRRRHTRSKRDWSSDVCSSDLPSFAARTRASARARARGAPDLHRGMARGCGQR